MPLRRLIVGSLVMLGAGVAAAQRQIGPDPAREQPTGVYVRDSAVAAEKLALAQRMERLREWDKAADVYQEIVEKYADRVVQVGGEGSAQRYASVTLTVQERLGKWDDDGLARYRARYESPAGSMLESASQDDPAALNRVVQQYFPTDAARSAGLRLVELYIENGEFAAAAWIGERFLTHHPGVKLERAKLLFRTALAEHLGQNTEAAKRNLDELKSKHPGELGRYRGDDVVLSEALEQVLSTPPAVAHRSSPDSWPIFGGDASRGRISQASGRPGARLPVDIPLVRAKPRPDGAVGSRVQFDGAERVRRDSGMLLNVMPVVDRGELFYQDNTRIYARGLESGLPLPGWAPGMNEGTRQRFASPDEPVSIDLQLTVTVTDSSVLGVLGQTDRVGAMRRLGEMGPGASSDTQLVCMDRVTASRRWSVSPRQFPEPFANLRQLDLSGSPLVMGDHVYVGARGGTRMQFEDAYVLCFSLSDGRLRWACYLASGNATGDNFNGMLTSAGVSHLAYAGGRIFAVTNLGAVAAVDAYAGTIVWLSLYPRPNAVGNPFVMQMGGQMPTPKPWAFNPAIARDGKVFCLPADTNNVLVYDAGSGEPVKRIGLAEFENADTLLGVSGDKLIVTGKNKVYCINWTTYDPQKRWQDNLHWYGVASISGGTEKESQDTIRGRGFVTADSVFVPTRVSLKRFSIKNGALEESYPRNEAWGPGEGPGNVIVTSDQVIIAGADNINVYSDIKLARAKLDREERASPNDPMPRLKYAETLFAAGEIAAAVEKLDQGVRLLGGINNMRPGAARDRVFARALAFAERSADPKVGSADPARAASLYDRAAAAALSPQQQVAWRMSRARFARSQRDFNSEVRLYQEVLAEPLYRTVLVPSEDGVGAVRAGSIAESAIAERIKDNAAPYAPFEKSATDALAAARLKNDAPAMLAVAQQYPNARVAPTAMLAAADAFEAAGKPRNATQVLGQAYRKYRDAADRARIIEAQARNYLLLPAGIGVAIGRLNEGAKLQGGPPPQLQRALKLPDGDTIEGVTFAAAAEILQRFTARQEQALLPDFNIPPNVPRQAPTAFDAETPGSVIGEIDQLIVPPREIRDRSRFDRVATWSANTGVAVYAIGNAVPLGVASTIKQPPLGGVWVGNDFLVWTADSLALLRGDGAELGWTLSVRSLPQADVMEGPESAVVADDPPASVRRARVVGPNGIVLDNEVVQLGGFRVRAMNRGLNLEIEQPGRAAGAAEQIAHVRPVGDRVIVGTSTGRLVAVELSSGLLAWQTRIGQSPIAQLIASDDFIAARIAEETGPQIVALDTFAGQIVLRKTFNDANVPQNMALAPDGTLIYTLMDRICGKDLYEPGTTLRFDNVLQDGNPIFAGANQHDQLVIAEGRILAIADQGQFVRILSLDQGREMGRPPLSTGMTNNLAVWMRSVGPRVYVFNKDTVTSYHIDRLDQTWTGMKERGQHPPFRDAFVGKRHIVMTDCPTQAGAAPVVRCRLVAYARYPSSTQNESGRVDYSGVVTNAAGIDQWQAVDGGFYYHSIDRKLHFLRGSAAPDPKAGS